MTSLFISYSRRDIDAARRLTDAFKGQELDFWIDWEGIPPTVDWWKEIEKGIEEADIFLFLISPDSTKSKICRQEIDHAIKNGKRLIPVVVREIQSDESPEALSHLNYMFFRETDEFEPAFNKLLIAIKTDFAWAQVHRQLQVKALEWDRSGKEDSFLLHGKELQDAEFQLATNTSKEPHPTDLQREYVFKSRQASDVSRRRTRSIGIGVIIALLVLSAVAWVQAGRATTNAEVAEAASILAVANAGTAQANEQEAQRQADLALARELAASSINKLDLDPELSLHLAILSIDKKQTLQGEEALRRALLSPPVERTLRGHSGTVYSVAYDSDGKRLVTASEDGTARIWDAATGEELIALSSHEGAVKDAAFSPDGRLVATAGADGIVMIWDTVTGEQLRSMKHQSSVNSVAFSPDGQMLVTASDDATARVWNVDTGRQMYVLRGHSAAVLGAAFSPDGKLIATGGNDTLVKIWNAATGEFINEISNGDAPYNEAVADLAFSEDSQYVLTTGGYIPRLLDIQNAFVLTEYLEGHTFYVISGAISPGDGRQVVTASRDHTIRIWDTETARSIEVLRGHSGTVNEVVFDPTGNHLATASEDQTVRIWNIGEWRKRILIGHTDKLTGAAYSSNGQLIATASEDRTIQIWNAQTGHEQIHWEYPGWLASGVAFSPDDQQLITASGDGTWRIWDVDTAQQLSSTDFITSIVHDARFNKDGTRIIIANRDTFGYILDADTKELQVILEGHTDWVASAMFGDDGKLAVTASADGTARLWNAETGEPLRIFAGHSGLVTRAAFSSDGKRIVTSSVDGTARIWDTATGEVLQTLKGHTAEVTDAAFSPNDDYVATASRDNTARLWNPDTGDEVVQLFGHTDDLRTVAFSQDGRYLLTSSFDDTARIYPVYFDDVLALARSLLSPRELTCAERIKYLHDEICTIPTLTVTPTP
ncbi:MAG TPA: TIR domain-containing protein [Anaerolineales bacterium]|nr:TIR domain-containing protein [Anaerolineales bacterium]